MGRRGPESFIKRQKELKRKQKAMEKMARRQGKLPRRVEETGRGAPAAEAPEGVQDGGFSSPL
jgi:hypothetical protein